MSPQIDRKDHDSQDGQHALPAHRDQPVIVTPITLREARAFVTRVHRHHRAPQGGLFAIAASEGDDVVAVAIVGMPVARMLADGFTAEVTRLAATEGTPNACSMLYAAAWRAARAMGYRRLVTYTLAEERGTSLVAAGWKRIGEAGGGIWDRKSRPRVDTHPTQAKIRWEPCSPQILQRESVPAVTTVHATMTDSRRRKREAPPLHMTSSGSPSSHAVSSRIAPPEGRLGGAQGGYGSESSGCLDRPVSEPSRRS